MRGIMDAIYGEGSATSKKVSLRLRHHSEKFPNIRSKRGKYEYDIKFEEFPFGLEFEAPPIGVQGTLVTEVEKQSFSAKKGVKKGHDLIGVDGQNVWHQPWSIVKHVLSNANYPISLRFRKPYFSKLSKNTESKIGVSRYTLKQPPLGMEFIDNKRVLEDGKESFTSSVSLLKKKSEAKSIGIQVRDYLIGVNEFDVMNSGHDAGK
tara:strand:+ start:120 stop:737 length:618 start_codon:yes stop_codon:yes gene_type:complete